MEEIRRTKIKEAMKETLNVYEKLDLNMTEIEIVSRSQNVATKVAIAKKQLETEAEERLACVVYCKCKDHLKQLRRNKN